jgi:anti-sigma factor RsiW
MTLLHNFDWLAFVEERALPHDHQRAEAHLAVCAECRAAVIHLADMADQLRAVPRALKPNTHPQRHWSAVWARVSAPTASSPYPTHPLTALLSMMVVCVFFANTLATRWAGQGEASDALPQAVIQTPLPPGYEAAQTTSTQISARLSTTANALAETHIPRVAPVATPTPGPTE